MTMPSVVQAHYYRYNELCLKSAADIIRSIDCEWRVEHKTYLLNKAREILNSHSSEAYIDNKRLKDILVEIEYISEWGHRKDF